MVKCETQYPAGKKVHIGSCLVNYHFLDIVKVSFYPDIKIMTWLHPILNISFLTSTKCELHQNYILLVNK